MVGRGYAVRRHRRRRRGRASYRGRRSGRRPGSSTTSATRPPTGSSRPRRTTTAGSTAWFNNAGVGDDGRLVELTDEQVQRLVEVNLLGCLWGMRAALAAFDGRGGDIVNIASLSGLGPVPGYAVYAATKAADRLGDDVGVGRGAVRRTRARALPRRRADRAARRSGPRPALGSQLVHSGGRILTVDETADAAVALVGSRRVVRTLPGWRGALSRISSLAPSLAKPAADLFAAQGRRRIEKKAARPRT